MYLLSSQEDLPADELVRKFTEKTGNRGGGNKSFAQISIKDVEKPIEIIKEIIKNF